MGRIITDMHCHVLPGVDDGPKTVADSIAVLREAKRQHVEAMIVTPHFHPGRYKVYASQIGDVLGSLREEAARKGLSVTLIPGQECYYYSELVRELNAGHVLTMAGSRYVLTEFDPEVIYSVLRNAVRDLVSNGYIPIIAHFERYRCLLGENERLDQLRYDGAKLQLNFDRLLAKDGFFRRNPWRRLLLDGYVDYLGSDTHGMEFRPPHIDQALTWLLQADAAEASERILYSGIDALLAK